MSPHSSATASRLGRILPFLRWWPRVNRETLRADAVAGLIGAIIVLPQGIAFATLAGLPPQYGLYAAMVPAIVAALFGSSWHLVSGPTNVISIFLFASLAPLAVPGSNEYIRLALTLTFLVGVMQLAMGLARMGALVNFISHTVVIGFTAGAACLIFAAQIRPFFGVDIPPGSSFARTWHDFALTLGNVNPYVMAVGTITLLTGIVFGLLPAMRASKPDTWGTLKDTVGAVRPSGLVEPGTTITIVVWEEYKEPDEYDEDDDMPGKAPKEPKEPKESKAKDAGAVKNLISV